MSGVSSSELRSVFLEFFHARGHQIIPSSPLVPAEDPTLLFTNAGMVQFKDIFLGRESSAYSKAATSQRCVRAGGKHNDLENVGYTARHHTFFEMLGNFSFGDYFKEEAIHYTWELLTKVYNIPANRLWITVFEEDTEAERIWLNEIKVDPTRFGRIGAKDNFWSMGEIGPCGPCTEVFYDHGDAVPGGPPGSPEAEMDRFVEIWNLVFMQYERAADGILTPLPRPSVDTGMGLERLAAVVQGVHNNYEIDLFKRLILATADLAKTQDLTQSSLRVVADHIRSCAFLVSDGVLPSNGGRGYVLRRIIRRAIRHGYRLNIPDVFFYKLVKPLCDEMGEAYPELIKGREQIERVLRKEEQRFAETLDHGMKILEGCVESLTGKKIPGDVVFQLYDTHGFPVDLIADFARERGLGIDHEGFENLMDEQRQRARADNRFSAGYSGDIKLEADTEFTGYQWSQQKSSILALFRDGESVECLNEGEDGTVILGQTPFYAESGGQVGDKGVIRTALGNFDVIDTQKQGDDLYLHSGRVAKGRVIVEELCDAEVDASSRQATALNHSATHLLHAALRQVLGEHITQKGSLVDENRLRFDFSHDQPVENEEIHRIEAIVNTQIRLNSRVTTEVMDKDQAVAAGAMALFGEKYGNRVRVVKISDFSTELCGGTHVNRAGDIGFFKIISETGIAAGIRRVEAVTGQAVVDWVDENQRMLEKITGYLKGERSSVVEKIQQLMENNRQQETEIIRLKAKMASKAGNDLSAKAVNINGILVLAAKLDDVDSKTLRETVDQVKNKLGSAVVVLATVKGQKVSLVGGVTKNQIDKIKAGDLVNIVASKVGGKGGGRADMAQAGGNNPDALDAALKTVPEWVREQLETV